MARVHRAEVARRCELRARLETCTARHRARSPRSHTEAPNTLDLGGVDAPRALDVLVCGHCGGARKLIALITDGQVVRKILAHLGLATQPPTLATARAPSDEEFAW